MFAQFTGAGYTVGHTVIAPDGTIAPITATENDTAAGRSVAVRRVIDPLVDALIADYARALFREGGGGPVNVQLRQDRKGVWKAVEINLRTSGGTLTRFLRGIDELHLIMKAFVPGIDFPELHPPGAEECTQVTRQYYTHPTHDSDVSVLKRSGSWSRPSP